jgi:hypothetical protein
MKKYGRWIFQCLCLVVLALGWAGVHPSSQSAGSAYARQETMVSYEIVVDGSRIGVTEWPTRNDPRTLCVALKSPSGPLSLSCAAR